MRNSWTENNPKKDKVLERTSKILNNTYTKPIKENNNAIFSSNSKNIEKNSLNNEDIIFKKERSKYNIENGLENEKENDNFKPKSKFTPFLLLITLSLDGLFEGIAVGIQMEMNGILFLATAIISHKWAEAFTLVIFLYLIYLFNFF